MVVNAVALVASCCVVAYLPEIPSPSVRFFTVLLALFLVLVLVKRNARTLIAPVLIFVSGFLYASACASYQLSSRLPGELLGVELELTGTVIGLPVKSGRRLRFLCDIDSLSPLNSKDATGAAAGVTDHIAEHLQVSRGRLRIDWYGSEVPDLKAGNKIKVVVKLKSPSGFMNPGGFDLERWLTQKKIIATGYVRSKSFDVTKSIVSDSVTSLASVRHKLQRRLLQATEGLSAGGVILALTVGDKNGINDDHWDTFISTGTNHLLAISGLHISLVAGFVALLARSIWRIAPLATSGSKQTFALLAALLAATCYAAMAGFTVPTVRALTMFATLALLMMHRRHQRRAHSLAIAVIVVCLSDPMSVLSAGFWMSFAAVAVLYLVFSDTYRADRSSFAWRLLRGHVLVSLGLYPLTILFFQQASLIAPLANLLVTPIVAMLVTPVVFVAALVALISVPLAASVLMLANYLLEFSLSLLMFLASSPWALLKVAGVGYSALLLGAFAAVVCLIPVSLYTRLICLVLLLPLFFPHTDELDHQSYAVTFLDVGQGTSVVVRTRHRVLVYDTGDQFSQNFSAAEAVVIPYLRSKGIEVIDKLVVSHADRDHSGGADELLDQMNVSALISSAPLPQRMDAPFVKCEDGMQWVWDGVKFKFLHPRKDSGGSKNDMSCVLKISSQQGYDTLLPGDVEVLGERSLVAGSELSGIDILMSPHHGSLTSSGIKFINKAGAAYVVHTVGYQNRFGFPKQEVVSRYAASDAKQYRTDQSGAIEFIVTSTGIAVSEHRKASHRWWYRQ